MLLQINLDLRNCNLRKNLDLRNTDKTTKILVYTYRGFPTYVVFTTADPTTAIFGLCTCKQISR